MASSKLNVIGGHPTGALATLRSDKWWAGPLTTFAVISVAMTYMTWAAFQGEHFFAGPYLSPLYSPVLFVNDWQVTQDWGVGNSALHAHAWFGTWPTWWPSVIPASPALLILMFPGSFRFTCYYYRKAYYRAFALSPPGCAVTPGATGMKPYKGEGHLLLFQNLHRYALYAALAFLPILFYDAFSAFFHAGKFGVGVGSIVLLINASLLASYTFGCHSFRHLVGGRNDCMSCGESTMTFKLWNGATWFNMRHMNFAWVSLIWVCFSDVYVRAVSMGLITDFNTWGV